MRIPLSMIAVALLLVAAGSSVAQNATSDNDIRMGTLSWTIGEPWEMKRDSLVIQSSSLLFQVFVDSGKVYHITAVYTYQHKCLISDEEFNASEGLKFTMNHQRSKYLLTNHGRQGMYLLQNGIFDPGDKVTLFFHGGRLVREALEITFLRSLSPRGEILVKRTDYTRLRDKQFTFVARL
ncbi:MAG TPA: hypothetical protein VJC16_01110 [Candidatus Nanoarchaeia archaeon]|nr:hypothetical protein [Candidatus Nanoarchaeia archaeon]